MSRVQRIARWWTRPARRGWVAVLFLLLIIAAVLGFKGLTNNTHDNHHLAKRAGELAAQTQALVLQGRKQRLGTIAEVCHQTDDLTHKLRALIIAGATGTKAFDRQIRALGFPPYRVRLAQARKQAASLVPVDCKALGPKGAR